jgi:hypothetical protein
MSDIPAKRVERSIDTEAQVTAPLAAGPVAPPSPPPAHRSTPGDDERLRRIEDKASRLEEKYARTEAMMARLEDKVLAASDRTQQLATQSDLRALSARVGRVPGFGALIVTAVLAGILAAIFTVLVLRYGVPGIMDPILTGGTR